MDNHDSDCTFISLRCWQHARRTRGGTKLRWVRFFTISLIFLSTSPAPSAAQQTGVGDQTNAGSASPLSAALLADSIPVESVTSDSAIKERLDRILRSTGWLHDPQVSVDNSVVILQGTASTQPLKEKAIELANKTEGVAAVVDQLQVDKSIDASETFQVVTHSVKNLWEDFLAHSPLILAGLVALILTSLINRVAHALGSRLASQSRLRSSMQDLILQLLTIAVWTVGLLVTAVIMFPGMTPSKALTVLGLGSVAVGFAFKDIFENFFAGILILWKYPFDRGDFVQCEGITGRIEDITIRMSMIRKVDGQLVVVPNALLFKNPVDVLTNKTSRRTTIFCGVAYDVDLNQAREVITDAVKGCSSVRQDPAVEIFAHEFADSSINFEVTWWTGARPVDIRKSRDEVVRSIKQKLDAAGIEIPFPQRTLWLPEPVRTESLQTDSPEATPHGNVHKESV